MIHFPVSGVTTHIWLPPLVAFVISFFTSMGGISGAFLLLPFQMSVLGFTSPAVSPTNLIFNLMATPGGVYRYLREGRLLWPLAALVLVGTLPGVILGGIVRVHYLPDAGPFKAFVGCVLLYMAVRLLLDVRRQRRKQNSSATHLPGADSAAAGAWRVEIRVLDWRRLIYVFENHEYRCGTTSVVILSLVVGLISGVYGIGGGALLAPIFLTIYGLPVHTVAGATLLSTLVTSIVGVGFYQALAAGVAASSLNVAPDWLLGALFGLGGMAGMYLGARTQRLVPAVWIKGGLVVVLLLVALRYLIGYVLR
jgi:uncharacterized membrane protein YfcA